MFYVAVEIIDALLSFTSKNDNGLRKTGDGASQMNVVTGKNDNGLCGITGKNESCKQGVVVLFTDSVIMERLGTTCRTQQV